MIVFDLHFVIQFKIEFLNVIVLTILETVIMIVVTTIRVFPLLVAVFAEMLDNVIVFSNS